ncbi:hypothetical protein DNTS_022753 [Danionella cerebrum]|uniref:Uncharacterized protein n=1 Tax=Danionella cerebrum TaxID=2873325 RepID=A0A553NH36_9TELE|nr:hypothetical protein DNTS_022753 [Danionella translucida]
MEDTLSTENKDSSSLNREKPNPAEPSCVSLKSDRSMIEPIAFNDKTPTDKMGEKPNPAPPSCVSLKSDWSMIEPITFNNKTTTDKMREIISSEPSCRSMMEFEERKR